MAVKIEDLSIGQEVWLVGKNDRDDKYKKVDRKIIEKIQTTYIEFEDTWEVLHFNNISKIFTDWEEAVKAAGFKVEANYSGKKPIRWR